MWSNRRFRAIAIAAFAVAGAGAAAAQLLPRTPLEGAIGDLGRLGGDALGTVTEVADDTAARVGSLARLRVDRLRDLVRTHRGALEMTALGPAVRGEVVAVDPDARTLDAVRHAGFEVIADEQIEGLDIRSVTLRVPHGVSIAKAMVRLRRIAPGQEFAPNHLHLQSGASTFGAAGAAAIAKATRGAAVIGIIDGGVASHRSLGSVEQRGFAAGAPAPSAHGTAIASLAAGRGPLRGAAPGAGILVADVYGRDPKGGNAVAIARALGFLAARRVKVVSMSLVGPPNPLVAKAIGRVLARGIPVIAAVGNDGPAAPPAYPASYKGVIAVTGVDRRNRPLIEAGRALHLDFAAPGADMVAAAPGGGLRPVRGTSYAVPFVAGRLARASLAAVAAEARDLGPKGPDRSYGRGLVCGDCRTPIPEK